MSGQVEDRRVERGPWEPVLLADHDLARLGVSPAPPVRRIQELRPVSVTRVAGDRQVVDLGQNINGWLRLTDLGPRDTELALLHGEVLDANGDVTTDHLGVDGRAVGQLDRVISAGRPSDVFEPRHTVHGFQHVRIEGHPHRLTPDDATGVVVHTDLRRTGWFRCSDERINRFHENAEWSFRDNACDIPTDCPHRERSGWTGDWQIFLPSAAFLYDVAGFSVKWLRDLAADQLPNGLLAN
jgi:alpha-L-rhamnosidase